MDDAYDSYGITLKPWFAAKGTKSKQNSYNVIVVGWQYQRRVIERDGLISFQVTVHRPERCCWTCEWRVSFIKQQLADHHVQCFWTADPGSLYVTVGPAPPKRPSAETYLSFILGLPVLAYSRRRRPRKQRQAKAASRKRHRIVH